MGEPMRDENLTRSARSNLDIRLADVFGEIPRHFRERAERQLYRDRFLSDVRSVRHGWQNSP
jgi:hypothetical protein